MAMLTQWLDLNGLLREIESKPSTAYGLRIPNPDAEDRGFVDVDAVDLSPRMSV